MNTEKLKLAARGLVAVAFGLAGIYAAECLECWQPHGVMLSVGCVALVLASMYLAISGPLVLSRLVRRREEQEQEEQPPPDPHFEAALDSWSWVASLHGICIL